MIEFEKCYLKNIWLGFFSYICDPSFVFVSDICFHLLFVSYKPFIDISKFLVSIRKERKYISVPVKDLNCLQTLLYQEDLKNFWDHWHGKEKTGILILIHEESHSLLVPNWLLLWGLFQYTFFCLEVPFYPIVVVTS